MVEILTWVNKINIIEEANLKTSKGYFSIFFIDKTTIISGISD